MPIGVGSNMIVRSGGVPGVTVRLPKAMAKVAVDNMDVRAGGGAMGISVASAARDAGVGGAGVSARHSGNGGRRGADECRGLRVGSRGLSSRGRTVVRRDPATMETLSADALQLLLPPFEPSNPGDIVVEALFRGRTR